MTEFKVTQQQQLELLKNDPVHYQLSITWDWKEQAYCFSCDSRTAQQVKKIIDN